MVQPCSVPPRVSHSSDFGGSHLAQDTLYSRALVLKTATDTLTDSASRRQYERHPEFELSHSDLPGEAKILCSLLKVSIILVATSFPTRFLI